MKMLNHILCPDRNFVATPNMGGALDPKYLVIHFTAGSSAKSSVEWMADKRAKASAHFVIKNNGTITQMVPCNRIAWHAGRSSWEGHHGLNGYSIGIELDNPGRLTRIGGVWRSWFQGDYADDDVIEATHKHESAPSGWLAYPKAQIEATIALSSLLVNEYDLRDVVGHDDISPVRKVDPGPAFPMDSFRAHVIGRVEDEPVTYVSTAVLNIRTAPGTQYPKLPEGPLPIATEVEVLRESGSWRFVHVLELDGDVDVEGWVHGDYLTLA